MNPKNGKILNVTDEEYYADPCERPSLNASTAKALNATSPAHVENDHPRLKNNRKKKSTGPMLKGSLVDEILTNGEKRVAVCSGFDDWRKKEPKEFKANAIKKGQIPCLDREYDEAMAIVMAFKTQMRQLGVKVEKSGQVAVQWEEETSNGEIVLCRCKMDFAKLEIGKIQDIKVMASASPDFVGKQIETFGYDLQAAAYTSANVALYPELAGETVFQLLCIEGTAPYPMIVDEFPESRMSMGYSKWQRGIDKWHKGLSTGHWPGYATTIIQTFPQPHEIARERLRQQEHLDQ